jgi:type VI secretion system protein ImpM
MTGTTGFFGKLPARGDFVERRLDRGFCRTLDDWLQAGMEESRARLGDAWLPLYLNAPLWRFAFAAGVCGALPATGVMMPSVDRVGRYFPLVLAVHTGCAAPAWYAAAEQTILLALEDDCPFAQFDAAVASLGPAAAGEGAANACVWWTLGSDAVPPCALVGDRLPDAQRFAAFVSGDHSSHGWHSLRDRTFAGLAMFADS